MEHLLDLIDVTADLPTPPLAIDDRALASNIGHMRAFCDRAGIDLRPHIETQESSVIARRQPDPKSQSDR